MCVYFSAIPNTFIHIMKTADRELADSGTFLANPQRRAIIQPIYDVVIT